MKILLLGILGLIASAQAQAAIIDFQAISHDDPTHVNEVRGTSLSFIGTDGTTISSYNPNWGGAWDAQVTHDRGLGLCNSSGCGTIIGTNIQIKFDSEVTINSVAFFSSFFPVGVNSPSISTMPLELLAYTYAGQYQPILNGTQTVNIDKFMTGQSLGFDLTGDTFFFRLVDDGNGDTASFNIANIDYDTTASLAAVPIPAAAWLFASGLIGLTSFARRKKA